MKTNKETTTESSLVKKPVFDYSHYERTGNNAIDLVSQCVGYCRKHLLPIKTVYLNRRYYDLFRMGVEVLQGRELIPGEKMCFDQVDIECNKTQFETLTYDLYIDKLIHKA